MQGPEATIVTYRNAKAIDQDCKIDAILIAQKVMEAYKSIAAVRTQFCYINTPSQYDQVEIHAGDVKAFDSGGLTKQRLLDSLPISRGGPGKQARIDNTKFQLMLKNYSVAPGFGLELRAKTLDLMQKIQNMSIDPSEFWPSFEATEKRIKSGLSQETLVEINDLHTKVYAAYLAADKKFTKHMTATQNQVNAMTSQQALSYQPAYGLMYKERMRLAQKINTLARAGEDVQWYQVMLFKNIEGYARARDVARLKSAISDLEIKLHLAPLE